ncbi:hypothetical protein VNI00_003721 [Paramarasmius palmivorus]|uniref:BRCT domain-containing protein n=1 Tax=Paramarasmius palmivorus TaxID=297713 RepID=A0AAW0DSD3_9AGAR
MRNINTEFRPFQTLTLVLSPGRSKNVESGEYYLVPNHSTSRPGSKRIVKRPNPPPTSPPLDEDFDAITQDRTTIHGRGPNGDRFSWVPTQAPLDSDFDAVTYTNYTGFEKLNEEDEIREEEVVRGVPEQVELEEVDEGDGVGGVRESEYWVHNPAAPSSSRNGDGYHHNRQRYPQSPRVQSPRAQSPRQHRTQPSEDFRSRYTTTSRSPERTRNLQNGADSSMSRYEILRSPTQRSTAPRLDDRRKAQNGYHRLPSERGHENTQQPIPSQSRPTKRSRAESTPNPRYKPKTQTKPRTTTTNGNVNGNQSTRPPAKQQSYEVVKSRVLEDTPEKTVTISTWRERVANELNGYGLRSGRESVAEMSVYYVNAEDYVDELNGRVYEVNGRKGSQSRSRSRSRSRLEQPVEWMGSHSPQMKKGRLSGGSRKGKERAFDDTSEVARSHIRDRVLTPWPAASEMGEIVDDDADDDPLLKHQRSRSLPMQLPDWEYDNHRIPDQTLPRTSTPLRGRTSPEQSLRNGHLSNGNGFTAPRSISLLPTREGSTISSIRGPRQSSSSPRAQSASTQPSSVQALDVVLGSCEPPLVHLAPILTEMGIRTEEHLRAIAKLSEATRDRELKEVAFKKGVTVVEWAILLDKLRTLSL